MAKRLHVKLLFLGFAILLLSSSFSWAEDEDADDKDIEDDDEEEDLTPKEEDNVLVLTEKNFDHVVFSEEIVLVEFYAPWCGHCKSLAPEYAKAAKVLKESTPPVPLAKVDATVHQALAQRFEVSGYPTLKFFKGGQAFEYEGGRQADDIVTFMKQRSDPNWKPPPSAVLVLTSENFTDTVNKEELMLVEFYAPWCGHCKQLAPKFEKAAQQLKTHEPPIPLAMVDATQEKDLASQYDISGFPTLKVFRKGRASEYKGQREAMGIVQYMSDQVGEAAKLIANKKELKAFLKVDDITVMGFFKNLEDPLLKTYMETANELREEYKWGYTLDKTLLEQYKVNPGTIAVLQAERFYTKYEPKWKILDKSDATWDDIKTFVQTSDVPLVGHFTKESSTKRYLNKRPLCLVYYTVDWSFDHRDATQLWRRKVAAIAKDYPDITFAIADEDDFKQEMADMGLGDSGEEINIGLLDKVGRKYRCEPMEEFEPEEIEECLDNFKAGKLTKQIKSQPVPKRQEGPVKIVVGKTFDKIVNDETKDVLIEFYAPWCGHCKQLEPKYKKLAKKFKNAKNLVIAKIDATANDSPMEYQVSGFPTIFFAPANNKKEPIKYEESGREVEDFAKFIEKHATVSLSKSKSKDEL